MTIGGSEASMADLDCSLPTMFSWTSRTLSRRRLSFLELFAFQK
jgi:hypothetical protein